MANPLTLWQQFLARPNDDRIKIFGIAVLVAFTCAVVVSVTSVTLKPLQDAQIEAERVAKMEAMLNTLPEMRRLMQDAGITALESRLVNLSDGSFASDLDAASFDAIAAADLPATSIAIPSEADLAGLKRRENHAPVYFLESDGKLKLLVLPMRAAGTSRR